MDNFEITKVNSNDITSLQKVGKKTFFETFSQTNTEENMQKYLEESFSSNKLLEELNNPDSKFYFAKYNDEIVGYLKLNFGHSQTELNDNESLEIERIYVLKDFEGKKIGQKLYEKAVKRYGELEYNQSFCFFPLLGLGGKKSIDNLDKGDTLTHIYLITELVGKVGIDD